MLDGPKKRNFKTALLDTGNHPSLRGVLVKAAVKTANAAVVFAVITAVVADAVLPGVLGRAVAVPAAAPAATIAAVSAVTLKAKIVPPAHLLPLLAAEGLLAPTSVVAAAAVAGDAAAYVGSAGAAAAPSTSRVSISARAAAVVARAPGPLPVLSCPVASGRRLAVGHLLHKIEGRLRTQMLVWMNRVCRPSRADGLCHLLVAVATPADQLKAATMTAGNTAFLS
jgi:hypothetical protein